MDYNLVVKEKELRKKRKIRFLRLHKRNVFLKDDIFAENNTRKL